MLIFPSSSSSSSSSLIHQTQLPMTLKPLEQHNFVVVIEPLSISPAELSRISSRLRTLFSLQWSCEYFSCPVVLQRKAVWSKPAYNEILFSLRSMYLSPTFLFHFWLFSLPVPFSLHLFTFLTHHHVHSTDTSPVPLHKPFTVYITVSNYGNSPHAFSIVALPASHPLVMNPDEADLRDDVGELVDDAGASSPTLPAGVSVNVEPSPQWDKDMTLPFLERTGSGGTATMNQTVNTQMPLLCLETSVRLG